MRSKYTVAFYTAFNPSFWWIMGIHGEVIQILREARSDRSFIHVRRAQFVYH